MVHKFSAFKKRFLAISIIFSFLQINLPAAEYAGNPGDWDFTLTEVWRKATNLYGTIAYSCVGCAGSFTNISSQNTEIFYFCSGLNSSLTSNSKLSWISKTGNAEISMPTSSTIYDGWICNDEVGNIIVGATNSGGNGLRKFYVLKAGTTSWSNVKTFTIDTSTYPTVTGSQNRAWGLRAYCDCYNGTGYVAMIDRANGVTSGTGNKNFYRIKIVGSGVSAGGTGSVSAIDVYTMSVGTWNSTASNATRYGNGKFLIQLPNSSSGSGQIYMAQMSNSNMNMTALSGFNGNIGKNIGATAFQLQSNVFVVASNTNTASTNVLQLYNYTTSKKWTTLTFISGTPNNPSSATNGNPSPWVNAIRRDWQNVDLFIWSRQLGVGVWRVKAEGKTVSNLAGTGSPTSKTITWSATSGTSPASYTIQYYNGSSWVNLATAHTSTSYTDTDATRATQQVRYRVAANYNAQDYNINAGDMAQVLKTGKYTEVKVDPKLATPTFTDGNNNPISNGHIFSPGSKTIRIHYPSGSTLHYKLNGGTEQTQSGSTYYDVNLSRSGSLTNVYVSQTDHINSDTASLTWYFQLNPPSPNYTNGYTFNYGTNTVRLTAGGDIYYDYNGSTISGASPLDVSVTQNTSLTDVYAKSTSSDYLDSDKISLTYYVRSADVTYSPSSATSFSGSTNITLTSASGGTIYYTTDGTTPTTSSSSVASGGTVTISSTCQIKAFAVSTNYVAGNVTTSPTYTSKCATPVITPATGTYSKAQTVNIACSTPGATIRYTTDGSTPTASSPIYSTPLTVNDGTTTNQYIPLYGYYADDFEKSEHIIPASSLSGMGASASNVVTLNSLTWYLSTPATGSFGAARFKVFLKEVSGTTLGGAFIGPDGGTVVYEGELDATMPTLTVSFTTPFEYHGGNLLVGVYTTTDGTFKRAYFYGTDGTSGCSGCAYYSSSLDNITTPNSSLGDTFLPKTTFTYSPSPLVVSKTTTVKAIAIKSGATNSDVASETITIKPQSAPATNIGISYSPVIGVSTNNPSGDLARIDATITFDRPVTSDGGTFPVYPSQFSDYYLDHYIVTVFSGSGYAKTESGANFLNVNIDAKTGAGAANTVTLKARDVKVGQNTEVYVTAHYIYSPSSTASQSAQASNTAAGYTYATYAPDIEARIYVTPHQRHEVWWGTEQEKHTVYADVYQVRISITDAAATSPIPVSYYKLEMSRNGGSTWVPITDRTVNNLYYGSSVEAATTYPAGLGLAAGRYPGNYRFNANKHTVQPIAADESEWDINFEYYYAYDVTSAYHPTTVTDPTQENPYNWQFRMSAVYGAGEGVTVDGNPVTVTTGNVQSSSVSVYMLPSTDPIITGVDDIDADASSVKEVRYYDLKGIRLTEVPQDGFYIEVRLYNDGRIVTKKRLAR